MCVGVYDITRFVPEHPGSPETLLDHAGGDASAIFAEIGHSLLARDLKESFLVVKPRHISQLQDAQRWQSYQRRRLEEAELREDDCRKGRDSTARRSDSESSLSSSLSAPLADGGILDKGAVSRFHARMEVEKKAVVKIATSNLLYVNLKEEFRVSSVPNYDHIACHDFDINRSQPVLHSGLVFSHAHLHVGQARAFYDPLLQEWCVWWSCCGWAVLVPRGQVDDMVRKMS